MNIFEAQKIGIREGNESAEFWIIFTTSAMERVKSKCKWIDAEKGVFEEYGIISSYGWLTIDRALALHPEIVCEPVVIPNNVVYPTQFLREAAA